MRIRSIKPEFWRSPDTAQLSHFARLLFVGLWNYVDDAGVGEYDEALIRSDLFPRDPVTETAVMIHGAITELYRMGQISLYEHTETGRRYIKIINWHHQKINRPTETRNPAPTSDDVRYIEPSPPAHGTLTEDSQPRARAQDQGIKGSRDQGNEGSREHVRKTVSLPVVQSNGQLPVVNSASEVVLDCVPKHLPRKVKISLLHHIEEMLKEDIPDELVRDAVAIWNVKADAGPGLLPYLIKEAIAKRGGSKGDRKMAEYISVAERLARRMREEQGDAQQAQP